MEQPRSPVRVGVFVVLAILIGGGFTFALGNQANMFSSKTGYHAVFEDVGGLRVGNVVRIAGVTVGTVDEVVFMDDGRVDVSFEVVNSAASLIRGRVGVDPDAPNGAEDAEDTAAAREEAANAGRPIRGSQITLGSKGMLGDRLVDIRPGHPSLPEWPSEEELPISPGGDLMALAAELGEKVDTAVGDIQRMTATLGGEEFNRDLSAMVGNLAQFTGMLASGDGAVQRLMTNPETADRLDETLSNLQTTSAEFRRTARSFRGIAEEVERGDGSAHALIYGDDGRLAVSNIGRASGEVAQMLEDVRTGDGTVHDLIYADAGEELIGNLTRLSDDLAAMSADMRAGRGTIGGLLVDPSIYEDVKRLVGDLQRNDILRSLVRYSIRRDTAVEDPPAVEEAE